MRKNLLMILIVQIEFFDREILAYFIGWEIYCLLVYYSFIMFLC